MSIYLPDTNILIDALNSKRGRKQFLQDLLLQGHKLACCCITVAEVYGGMRPHEEQATDQFLSALIWYDITRGVARHAGRLRFEWAQRGCYSGSCRQSHCGKSAGVWADFNY